MTTEERLESLERELTDLRAELAGGLTTRSVSIVDEQGKVRATLDVNKDGPVLSLFDEAGETRAMLNVNAVGPGLALLDENGKPRAILNVNAVGPVLSLFDENGVERARLTQQPGYGPGLWLKDEKGMLRAALSADETLEGGASILGMYDENCVLRVEVVMGQDGPSLFLRDEKGVRRVALAVAPTVLSVLSEVSAEARPFAESRAAALSLRDENGKAIATLCAGNGEAGMLLQDENCNPRAVLGMTKNGPTLGLADEAGQTIWSAP